MVACCRAFEGKRLIYSAILLFLVLLFVPVNVAASFGAAEGIDAILVIDTSGSMRSTDPDRITLEAASLFMDMMETRNSRIGIVEFSGNLHTVMPLTPISDISVRADVRRTISQFVYHGWTDIGLAMRTAAQMLLDDPHPTNSPVIILFTDGRIELPNNWASNRSVEISYEDAWWAVDNVGDFTSIYTIGLNYDGTVNTEFLQEIATRTGASYFIVYEADILPQIFNEIFASHIRSSITEVATIVADGDTYSEVVIPIPSAFVAEANIIMLSSRPITSVRLFDPSGREVPFDDETYTLTYANRYSMIKVLAPMVGDWLLSVRGLPEDRITVNLIYNYNVSVSFSVTQPDAGDGALFFDPTLPITVQAGFISALPASQIATLFNESVAEMHVYDMAQNFLGAFEMSGTGSAFLIDFELEPQMAQDVRININVSHEGFEQTTAFFPIMFDPQILAEFATEYEEVYVPAEVTEIEETFEYQPPVAAVDDYEPSETNTLWIFVVIIAAIFLVVAAVLLRAIVARRIKQRVFEGHFEIRALLADGNYTSLEAPDLSTFAGQMSMMEFLSNSLGGAKVDKLVALGIPVWDIQLSPGLQGKMPVVHLLKKNAACHITDGDGNAIFKKKITWEDGIQLVFSVVGESPRIEITYRAFEG